MLIRIAAAYLAFSGFFEAGAGAYLAQTLGLEGPSLHVTDDLCAVWSPPRRSESPNQPTVLCPGFWS